VSLKVSGKNHTIKKPPFPSEYSHSKRTRTVIIFCLDAVARSSLQSVSVDSLMPGKSLEFPH
jgi:hypothetical protein